MNLPSGACDQKPLELTTARAIRNSSSDSPLHSIYGVAVEGGDVRATPRADKRAATRRGMGPAEQTTVTGEGRWTTEEISTIFFLFLFFSIWCLDFKIRG